VDSAREQEKPEARKMPEKPHHTPASNARFVGRFLADSLMLSNSSPEISN
jgi:hypothetical protein